jgi:type I restriction enzyme S subunit
MDRFEHKDNAAEYQFSGTYSYGRGIFIGDRKIGGSFGLSKIQRIRANDFVYCKIMAWEGAFGIVPQESDNCVLSGAFVAYQVDDSRLLPQYLGYMFKTHSIWKRIGDQSTGTNVRRKSLHPDHLESAFIELPNLAEQQAIVARLDLLTEQTRQLEANLDAIERDAQNLLRAYIFHPPGKKPLKRPMAELVTMRQPDVRVDRLAQYQFAGVYSFGRGVFASVNKAGSEFAYERLSTVCAGDFTYPKLMAWEGALGVVPPECDGMVVSPEFPVFTINTEAILPEVMDIYFRTPEVWPELAEISGGTNMRRRRLQPSAFLSYEMPVPSMSSQLKLRELFLQTKELKTKHTAIRAANAALLPATLERVFQQAH